MPDVVVVGSLMIDMVSTTDRIPQPGETIHGKSFVQNFGGKGANQCIAAQRLETQTAMIGKVGDDHFGNQYEKELQNNGVNTDALQHVSGRSTGVASIWVDGKGQNSIIITANANEEMTPEDVRKNEETIKTSKVLICQLEIPQLASLEALKIARKYKVRSIFNPAPATPDLNPAFFENLDIICPNESESELICGFPVDSEGSCQKALQHLISLGAAVAIITLGEKGARFATMDNPNMTAVTADKVETVDTTGAGDAFIGALASFLVKDPEASLEALIQKACKYASLSVQKPGTQPSYVRMQDVPSTTFG